MSSSGTYRPPTLQTNESSTKSNTNTSPPDLLSESIMPTAATTTAPAPPPTSAGSPHSTASGSPRQRYHAVSNESESSGDDSDHGAAPNTPGANSDEEDTGMSLTELLYGTSSYHAIAKPGEFF